MSNRLHCPVCGRTYRGSQSSGGHCTGCHQSFRSNSAFEKHRVYPGGFKAGSGERVCLAPDACGMELDDAGDWRIPISDEDREKLRALWKKK